MKAESKLSRLAMGVLSSLVATLIIGGMTSFWWWESVKDWWSHRVGPEEVERVVVTDVDFDGTTLGTVHTLPRQLPMSFAASSELLSNGLEFKGEARELVAIMVYSDTGPVASHLRLFGMGPVDSGSENSSVQNLLELDNLESSRPGSGVFRLPQEGLFHVEMYPPVNRVSSVYVRAYSVKHFPSCQFDAGSLVEGELSIPGEVDLFAMEVAEGDRLLTTLEELKPNEAGAAVVMFDSSGLAGSIDESGSRVEVQAWEAGTLDFAVYSVRSSYPSTVTYKFSVRELDDTIVRELSPSLNTLIPGRVRFSGDSKVYRLTAGEEDVGEWFIHVECESPQRFAYGGVGGNGAVSCTDSVSVPLQVRSAGDIFLRLGDGNSTVGEFKIKVSRREGQKGGESSPGK